MLVLQHMCTRGGYTWFPSFEHVPGYLTCNAIQQLCGRTVTSCHRSCTDSAFSRTDDIQLPALEPEYQHQMHCRGSCQAGAFTMCMPGLQKDPHGCFRSSQYRLMLHYCMQGLPEAKLLERGKCDKKPGAHACTTSAS